MVLVSEIKLNKRKEEFEEGMINSRKKDRQCNGKKTNHGTQLFRVFVV